MIVNRVEQQIIRKSHPLWKTIDKYSLYSKNMYNYANYIIRQEFIKNGKLKDIKHGRCNYYPCKECREEN